MSSLTKSEISKEKMYILQETFFDYLDELINDPYKITYIEIMKDKIPDIPHENLEFVIKNVLKSKGYLDHLWIDNKDYGKRITLLHANCKISKPLPEHVLNIVKDNLKKIFGNPIERKWVYLPFYWNDPDVDEKIWSVEFIEPVLKEIGYTGSYVISADRGEKLHVSFII
jgi:hypothetical protein